MAGATINYYRNWTDSDREFTGASTTGGVKTFESFGWVAPTGREFKEWNDSRDGSGTAYQEGDSFTGMAPEDLYAQYATAEISKIIIPDGTEFDLKDATARTDIASKQDTLVSGTNIKTINGESILGSGNITASGGGTQNTWYGVCPTGATTQAKLVTTTTGDFTLEIGNMVRVKFNNAQTYNGGITLNVDGTGAKSAMRNGTTATTRYFYLAGEVVDFVYDGTYFMAVNEGIATTTYYGVTKLSNSTASTSTSLAATANSVKLAYDHADSKQDALVSGTNIKTVNNTSLLGSGDVAVQPTLVSGTNIKTVNNTSLLGSGNVAVQPTLVSGTNIKTINGSSILGSGDLTVGGGVQSNWNETDTTSLAYIQNKPQLNVLTATDDGNGNVTLTYTSVASATGVTF